LISVLKIIIYYILFKKVMETNKQTILAVLAHPDDETVFNGTLAMFAENNLDVNVVYATLGNAGSDATGQNLKGNELAEVREMELQKALKILKVSNTPFLLRFDDSMLLENVELLKTKLEDVFKKIQPEIVITFGPEGFTGHPDHKTLSSVVGDIVGTTDFVKQVLHIAISEDRHKVYEKMFGNAGVADLIPDKKIDFKIDVSQFSRQRKESVLAHRTQFPDEACAIWEKFVDATPYEEFKLAFSKKTLCSRPLKTAFL